MQWQERRGHDDGSRSCACVGGDAGTRPTAASTVSGTDGPAGERLGVDRRSLPINLRAERRRSVHLSTGSVPCFAWRGVPQRRRQLSIRVPQPRASGGYQRQRRCSVGEGRITFPLLPFLTFFPFSCPSFLYGAAVEIFSGPRPWPPFGSCFATSTNVDRDSWGRWRALVVELAVETKFIPAQRNTFGSGTSLKDLQILARGCDGTWLPRIPGPDRTQSCRDCIGERWGACAGGGQIVQCPERGPRGMAQSRTEFFSRAESKPGPPYAFPTGMKRSWGSYPG